MPRSEYRYVTVVGTAQEPHDAWRTQIYIYRGERKVRKKFQNMQKPTRKAKIHHHHILYRTQNQHRSCFRMQTIPRMFETVSSFTKTSKLSFPMLMNETVSTWMQVLVFTKKLDFHSECF